VNLNPCGIGVSQTKLGSFDFPQPRWKGREKLKEQEEIRITTILNSEKFSPKISNKIAKNA
jgi:hypothetical protein